MADRADRSEVGDRGILICLGVADLNTGSSSYDEESSPFPIISLNRPVCR